MTTVENFARPDARAATLTKIRNLKMSRSSHAYVRGNTVKFYEWLEGQKNGSLPSGPPVWICGDCHVGNLGPLANRFWPIAKAEKREIKQLFEMEEISRLATMLRSRDDDAPIKLLDAAYWMKGCSSLGRLRYAVILQIGSKKAKGSPYCIMDIKEAAQAAAPRAARVKMPADQAERVVEGARYLSPFLGKRKHASEVT